MSTHAGGRSAGNALRVAVLGASGIGKNHARWFKNHGCDVCAFLGSSPASIGRTRLVLQRDSNFAGRAYSALKTLLQVENPDAVCIATPPALHYSQTLQCLDAGVHVLCEKPLVGDESLRADELIAQARHLEKLARERGLLLETQTQYEQIAGRVLTMCGVEDIALMRRWTMEMETKNIVANRDREKIWLDLSPHPISLLLPLGAEIEWESVRCLVRQQETEAEFRVRFGRHETIRSATGEGATSATGKGATSATGEGATSATGEAFPCLVRIAVRVNADRVVPLRRISIDNRHVDYAAGKNAAGRFRNYLASDDGIVEEMDDLVDSLIANFVARVSRLKSGAPDANDLLSNDLSSNGGALNVEWQLKILEKAQRA